MTFREFILERLYGHRLIKVEALRVPAIILAQYLHLMSGLDTLGDTFHTELLRH